MNEYQKVLKIAAKYSSSVTPTNKWKVGGFRRLNDFDQAAVKHSALAMAEDLREIHQVVSAVNRNESQVISSIQAMFGMD